MGRRTERAGDAFALNREPELYVKTETVDQGEARADLVNTVIGSSVITAFRGPRNRVERNSGQAADGLDLFHMSFLQNGQTIASQDGRRNVIPRRRLIMLRSAAPFNYQTYGPVEIYAYSSHRLKLPPASAKALPLVTALPAEDTPVARAAIDLITLAASAAPPTPEQALVVEARLIALAHEVIMHQAVIADQRVRSDETLRTEGRLLIRANCTIQGYSPEDIARQLKIGVRRLHRIFEGDVDTLAHQIKMSRLDTVASRLRESDDGTVGEIAVSTGYAGADQCARAFKARYGMTMTAYRSMTSA